LAQGGNDLEPGAREKGGKENISCKEDAPRITVKELTIGGRRKGREKKGNEEIKKQSSTSQKEEKEKFKPKRLTRGRP